MCCMAPNQDHSFQQCLGKLEKVKNDVTNTAGPNGTKLKLLIADCAYKRQTIGRLTV